MGGKVFDNPKNPEVLARLFHSLTSDGDLIIDFFAGSGSTGQAVWEPNRLDRNTRHWLLVQFLEKPDASERSGKKALEEGYNTIFEITAERLRRTAASIDGALGFRIFRAHPSNLVIEAPIVASDDTSGTDYVQAALANVQAPPVVDSAQPIAVAWEVALKATPTQLDARVTTHSLDGVEVYEFTTASGATGEGRLLISLDAFDLNTADALRVSDSDTLILRGDKVEDNTTLTLAPRLQSKLVLLERIPREVSL